MKKILVIAKREMSSYFDSLIAYILIVLFLGFSGFFTWFYGDTVFLIGQASMESFFSISYWTLFLFIPAITMRALAEENRAGTIELLSTKAIDDWQIVLGKFLGCLGLILVTLACTLPFYFSIASLGSPDHGGILGGYMGLMLLSGMYISIGIFASSLTNNQIVAMLLSLLIGIFFHLLFGIMAGNAQGMVGSVLHYLNARTHFESLARGVLDTRDLIYFGSFIFFGLLLAQAMLSRRNWQA